MAVVEARTPNKGLPMSIDHQTFMERLRALLPVTIACWSSPQRSLLFKAMD